ncbi:MAG: hypothetical protein ACRD2O_04315 [Terriglobia bacterium]
MRTVALLAIAMALLSAGPALSQEVHLVNVSPTFGWPVSVSSAARANSLPKADIGRFFNVALAHVPGYWSPAGTPPMKIRAFRFVPLERGRFYLVLRGGDRWVQTYVLVPEKGSVRLADMQTVVAGSLTLAMSTPDLGGDGADELITARWAAGYQGASTPSIYWYTVWRFHDGVPEDASARFPGFYRQFVLREVDYPERLLSRIEAHDAKDTTVPLAEIDYVRLKYQRTIQGHANAGLEQPLAWAESKNTGLFDLGVFSLAEMPAPAAGKELEKLEQIPANRDLITELRARRAQMMKKIHGN